MSKIYYLIKYVFTSVKCCNTDKSMHHVETRRIAPHCASVIQGIATNVSFNPLIKRSTFFFSSVFYPHTPTPWPDFTLWPTSYPFPLKN